MIAKYLDFEVEKYILSFPFLLFFLVNLLILVIIIKVKNTNNRRLTIFVCLGDDRAKMIKKKNYVLKIIFVFLIGFVILVNKT